MGWFFKMYFAWALQGPRGLCAILLTNQSTGHWTSFSVFKDFIFKDFIFKEYENVFIKCTSSSKLHGGL